MPPIKISKDLIARLSREIQLVFNVTFGDDGHVTPERLASVPEESLIKLFDTCWKFAFPMNISSAGAMELEANTQISVKHIDDKDRSTADQLLKTAIISKQWLGVLASGMSHHVTRRA
jgi:hypothetical protein